MLNHKTTPRDVFLQLLSIVTLYIGVISVILALSQFINAWLPDQINYYSHDRSFGLIRGALASMFVSWPIFIYTSYLIEKTARQYPEKRTIGIRKWLTYLTLFIAAITIIISLITMITNFLGGELTTPFLLKALTVIVFTGAVFLYYRWDIKRDDKSDSKLPRTSALISSIIIIAFIVIGFMIMGSPADQRARRFDEQRINHLQSIQHQVIAFYSQNERLPENLGELTNDVGGFVAPVDPATDNSYEYTALADKEFELCAVFAQTRTINTNDQFKTPSRYNELWNHGAGRACFTRTIDEAALSEIPFMKPVDIREPTF